MPRVTRPARAFTLVEAVATMVILATVSGVLSGVVWAGVRAFDEGAESARLHNEASLALERISRDLRAIPPSAAGTPDISDLTPTSITWDGAARSLTLDGDELILTVDGQSGVLLRDVSSLNFRAYDEANSPLAASLSGAETEPIRRLSIELTASRGRAAASVRTKVFLRCMMLEHTQ